MNTKTVNNVEPLKPVGSDLEWELTPRQWAMWLLRPLVRMGLLKKLPYWTVKFRKGKGKQ